jgi:hypothetical protein
MARSRYVITEPDKPHFLTCTVMEWLPVFSRPEAVGILLESWKYQRENMDQAEQWRYSSARSYAGEVGLIEIDRWW